MHCVRLDHFVRFNSNGTVSRCGHMVNAPQFETLEEMESSSWLLGIRETMQKDAWPSECVRCQETEPNSIRMYEGKTHANTNTNIIKYLQVGGVLDNLCNAACLSCNENLSTRIGSLKGRMFPVVNNFNRFQSLPQDICNQIG
jgi:hypothetical protein